MFHLFKLGKLLRGIWNTASKVTDTEIQALTASLPHVLLSALADSTNYKYQQGWRKWVKSAENKPEVSILPADPFYVAIYLNYLVHTNGTVGAVHSAAYGINWAHHAAGYHSPTDDPFVKLIKKGSEKFAENRVRRRIRLLFPLSNS